MIISSDAMKDFVFYRISTDIDGKIFLEFKSQYGTTIKLKHSVIKGLGISIYHDTTLWDLFMWDNNNKGLKKYRIGD